MKNRNDPVIDTSAGGNIWVSEHAFDIPGININDKVLNTDKIELKCSKGAIKAVKFEFRLQNLGFVGIEGDGTKLAVIMFVKLLRIALSKEESYGNVQSVDGKYDGGLRSVVNGMNGWGID